mmetsp:Transcript_12482/g.38488  ORF Transcript_12482/g.38488 Transcript_12482/m.38488 type:complete len:384 (-) Transcript_12482:180-1331(-)
MENSPTSLSNQASNATCLGRCLWLGTTPQRCAATASCAGWSRPMSAVALNEAWTLSNASASAEAHAAAAGPRFTRIAPPCRSTLSETKSQGATGSGEKTRFAAFAADAPLTSPCDRPRSTRRTSTVDAASVKAAARPGTGHAYMSSSRKSVIAYGGRANATMRVSRANTLSRTCPGDESARTAAKRFFTSSSAGAATTSSIGIVASEILARPRRTRAASAFVMTHVRGPPAARSALSEIRRSWRFCHSLTCVPDPSVASAACVNTTHTPTSSAAAFSFPAAAHRRLPSASRARQRGAGAIAARRARLDSEEAIRRALGAAFEDCLLAAFNARLRHRCGARGRNAPRKFFFCKPAARPGEASGRTFVGFSHARARGRARPCTAL